MAMSHQVFLNADTLKQLALPLLRDRLGPFNFTEVMVAEEEDFDGEPVVRMVAEVTDRVPANDLISVTADIHDAIRKEGDDRFVYLSTHRPADDDEADDDIEE